MARHWLKYSVSWMLVQAAMFAAAACVASGMITLLLYVLLRQDPEYVVYGPLSTSTAAIWFAPAVILFAQRSPAAIVAALVLVGNAPRILHDPWRPSLPPAPEPPAAELFGSLPMDPPPVWRQIAPALVPSFCAQMGAAAVLLQHPALAGMALAMSAATMTVFAQRSHAVEPRRPASLPRSVLGLLLTLVLAIGLTVGGMIPRFAGRRFGMGGDGGSASPPPAAPVGPPGQVPDVPPGIAAS